MTTITRREELLFLYDVTDANPNGNPMDENKPRTDEETGFNIVTDVRLKRTIRDYLFNYDGHDGSGDKDIFVRTMESTKGGIQDGKARSGNFGNDREGILKKCIDIRLFGGVLPLEKDSITFTGPVQFKMGRSLHRVKLSHIKGTGAFAAKDGAKQQTFREEYILPYSLIAFYGIVNENAAKETGLTEDDVNTFYKALWEGPKQLISRSKMGHMPRLLVRVRYKEPCFFIGDLDKKIKLEPKNGLQHEELRQLSDFALNAEDLAKVLTQHKDKIETIQIRKDENLVFEGWNVNEYPSL